MRSITTQNDCQEKNGSFAKKIECQPVNRWKLFKNSSIENNIGFKLYLKVLLANNTNQRVRSGALDPITEFCSVLPLKSSRIVTLDSSSPIYKKSSTSI